MVWDGPSRSPEGRGLADRLEKPGNRSSSVTTIGGYEVALLYGYLAKARGREEWQGSSRLGARQLARPGSEKDGLVGLAAYFLERLPASTAAAGLELVVYHLDRVSRSKGDDHHGSEMPVQVDADTFGSLGGEVGLAAVCLRASQRSQQDEWRAFALKLLDRCLLSVNQRVVDDCGGPGWLSIGQILNRVFQTDGDQRCLDAAQKCIELGMRVAGTEEDNRAFLESPVWPALVLLAALTPVEPDWDRLLLCSGYKWPRAS